MFDIGFWEMALIAVIALVVVGPRELPALIRGVSTWMARARRMAGEFKAEFSREVDRAEELKRLVERETEIAELHKALEEARGNISLDQPGKQPGRPGRDPSGKADQDVGQASGDDDRKTPAVIDTPEAASERRPADPDRMPTGREPDA